MGKGSMLVMVSRKSCSECVSILESEQDFQVDRVCTIDLDEPGGFEMRANIPWLWNEVDVLPFWRIFIDGKGSGTVRGADLRRVRLMIEESMESHHLGNSDAQET